jgi:hypothetical protein
MLRTDSFCPVCRTVSICGAAARSSLYISLFKTVMGMKAGLAAPDVGRNKSARRQQGRMFPAIGVCRKHPFSLSLEPAYSGLRRDVYNDERRAWER